MPIKLQTDIDYAIALLKLMEELNSVSSSEAISEFERKYKDQIKPEHQGRYTKSRKIIWGNKVRWARAQLIRAGFMQKGGYGIWEITDDGYVWMKKHNEDNPEDKKELKQVLRDTQRGDRKIESGMKFNNNAVNDQKVFRWREKNWSVNLNDLLMQARNLLIQDPPEEATRYKNWYILIDNQPVSPKWLFHLITGEDYNEFDSPTARRKLDLIGLKPIPVGSKSNSINNRKNKMFSFRMERASRDQYLIQVAQYVKKNVSTNLQNFLSKQRPGNNYVQFVYRDFPRSHYEFTLSRKSLKFAFHFEGKQEDNYARLEFIKPHIKLISQEIGEQVSAIKWQSKSAQILMELSYIDTFFAFLLIDRQDGDDLIGKVHNQIISKHPNWENNLSDPIITGQIMVIFIESTYGYIHEAFQAFPSQRRRRKDPSVIHSKEKAMHKLVDEYVKQIHFFLDGRSSNRPSDEQICDWIQFCYVVGLFDEGNRLFELIDQGNLDNEWLYKRTKKISRICRIKINIA